MHRRLSYHPTMQRQLVVALAIGILLSGLGCRSESETEAPSTQLSTSPTEPSVPAPTLTADEINEGWQLLFNGSTFDGWRGLGRNTIPLEHWKIEDGMIRKVDNGQVVTASDGQPLNGGDIMTVDAYSDFELRFEWRVNPGANSGIKYNVSEILSTTEPPSHAALGFEYQILDDDLHPDARVGPNRTAAGLYDLMGPDAAKALRPVGQFNTGRIVFSGMHGEHWLNGMKVLEFDLDAPAFAELLAKSKYDGISSFAERRTGHIVLQDHGNDVWFKNIKIRIMESETR